MTRADIASVMKTLERIDLGGEVSFEENTRRSSPAAGAPISHPG
jgi:hypothetical protein